jgi:hypothetical protein
LSLASRAEAPQTGAAAQRWGSRWLVAGVVLLVIWKTALWLWLPLPTTDGGQSLSHTYGILRGDFLHSMYWHHWMEIYQLPYGYGIVTAPLMRLLPFGTLHNYFAASVIFALSSALITYGLLTTSPARHAKGFIGVVALAVFLYPHLWVMRPEGITVPLLLATIWLLRRRSWRALAGAALLVTLAGITHPISGLIGVLMVTGMAWEKRWRWQRLGGFYALVALFLALLYLPVILIDVRLWVENFIGFFTREEPRGVSTLVALRNDLPRFVGWSAVLLLLYGWGVIRLGWRAALRDVLFAAAFLVPIIVGRGGSYFTYLLVFMVWRFDASGRRRALSLPVAVALLLAAPLWTHYFPTFQNLENPRYGETVRAIMAEVDTYSGRVDEGLVWLSTPIGLPIIDEPYARVIANYYAVGRYPERIAVRAGDVFLYDVKSDEDLIFAGYAITPETARIETLIPPVPGLLTFESLLRQRLPDLGLWRLTPAASAGG